MIPRAFAAFGCAVLLAAQLPAQAVTATFDDRPVAFLGNGESVTSNGLVFAQGGDFGGVADAATFSVFANAPTGNTTRFYAALNDSSVTLTMAGGAPFLLTGFSYAYVSPIGGLYDPGDVPGALVVSARSTTGATWTSTYDFGAADATGAFSFVSLTGTALGALATSTLSSVTFSACAYSGSSACVSPSFNLNQFALDNVSAVPEPAPLALALLGLAVVGGAARRRGLAA